MIAKIALLFAAVAAAQASIIAPGLLSPIGAIPTAVKTGTIVTIPGATSVDNRVIASNGLVGTTAVKTGSVVSHLAPGLVGAPLLNTGLLGAPIMGKGLIGAPLFNTGLIGAPVLGKGLVGGPLAINSGLVAPGVLAAPGLISPIGLHGAGLLAAPGLVKTIL
ncbi:elastin-like [Parasteatoda tepidariorum]|uniref:elastin-like n=1 Tax=Parasteatoda tepidariorum TaxID=114398 RepID=UPI00077FCE3B|nr:uncharacterized protein LOC107451192 [Parasteatoda tepidariorum]